MKVLIAEDEILLGSLLAEMVTDAGYHVLGPALSRAEALGLISVGLPDVALVDIDLQGRDSGIELVGDLARSGVSCLFVTGQCDKARSERAHAIGFIAKPYTPMMVVEALRFLDACRAGQRPPRVPAGLELFTDPPPHALESERPLMLAS
jgi:two-component system, response regulator PdtaR